MSLCASQKGRLTPTHASAMFLFQAPFLFRAPAQHPGLTTAFLVVLLGQPPSTPRCKTRTSEGQHQTWTLPSLKGPGRGAALSSLLLLRCCLCAKPPWHMPIGRQTLSLIRLCMQAAAREGAGAAAGGGRELQSSRAAARRQPAHPQLQTWRHRGMG